MKFLDLLACTACLTIMAAGLGSACTSDLKQRVSDLDVGKVEAVVTEVVCRAEVLAPYAEYFTKDQLKECAAGVRSPEDVLQAAEVAMAEVASIKEKLELCK